MANGVFLGRVGVLVRPHFLDGPQCRQLAAAMLSAPGAPAEVVRGGADTVDEASRRARVVDVPLSLRAPIEERLREIKPELERFFSAALDGPAPVEPVVYDAGGLFRPHRDRDGHGGDAEASARRVTVVIVVNDQAAEPAADQYAGGDLRLYGLLDGERWRDIGFPVDAAAGQLVAFRAETLHDVAPVTAGRRCVLVTWLY
jgi:SM-20-related protein